MADLERDPAPQPEPASPAPDDVDIPRATLVRELDLPTQAARREASHSDEIGELVGALAAASAKFGEIERSRNARIEMRKGGSFEFDFEDLSDILAATRPALAEQGVFVFQSPENVKGGICVTTTIAHKSGQWYRNRLALPCDTQDPHAVGSAISYARRYSYKAGLCLAPSPAEDDDGALARASVGAAAPRPAQRKSAAAAPVGTVVEATDRNGALLVRLSSGFRAATRDAVVIEALRRLKAAGQTVELVTTPATDPAKYVPTITEIVVAQQ